MGKLVPVILMLGGLLGGLGAGYALKPAPPECQTSSPAEDIDTADGGHSGTGNGAGGQGDGDRRADPVPATESPAGCAAPDAPQNDGHVVSDSDAHGETGFLASSEFAKLPTQFVIPVLNEGRMRALVVLSISLEIKPGSKEAVFSLEPKLRDGFLKVLFRHANSGGFDGNFTDRRAIEDLRGSLHQAAKRQLGDMLIGILILDIVRQDVG